MGSHTSALEDIQRAKEAELEACSSELRGQLEALGAQHARTLAKRASYKDASSEFHARSGSVAQELQVAESAAASAKTCLDEVLQNGDKLAHELRTEESSAMEMLNTNTPSQDTLRRELIEERSRAQLASRAAGELMEQRQRVSDEADFALRHAEFQRDVCHA